MQRESWGRLLIFRMKLFLVTTILAAVASASRAVEISGAVEKSFENLKLGERRFVVLRIVDETIVDVDIEGPRTDNWDDFVAALSKNDTIECRYGVVDYEYIENETPTKKVVSVFWKPEGSGTTTTRKLACEAGYEKVKEALDVVDESIETDNVADLEEETTLAVLKKIPLPVTSSNASKTPT